jgi:Flp pilus assembly pilin Flp
MKRSWRETALRLPRDERGLTTVEYVIVLCLIAAVAVGTWDALGEHIHDALQKADSDITTALES